MMIAGRLLKLRQSTGDTDIPIRIFLPERHDDGAWSCRYEIDWPDRKHSNVVWGIDSIQAIILTYQCIGAEIYASKEHESGNLMWGERGKGYGFPVTSNIRNLLIGDDQRFF
jgi:hypothetical protein